ncbi:flavin reductase family protein [Micromonospora sp. NPDC047707]|uniref:flavin reductase family protein n=1 Tax=Micromonospora sp. NPDC047707 TaxID=3154498 RepID=UPI003451942E
MRRAMGRFATGVAVITTRMGGVPHGMTVNSLTSVSLDPPLLLVCFNRGARTAECVQASGRFAVNILGARQEQVSNTFARRGENHFDGLDLPSHPTGVPLIPGALAHAVCRVDKVVNGGDHIVVFGLVEDVHEREGAPLLFYGGRYGDLTDRGQTADFWYC